MAITAMTITNSTIVKACFLVFFTMVFLLFKILFIFIPQRGKIPRKFKQAELHEKIRAALPAYHLKIFNFCATKESLTKRYK